MAKARRVVVTQPPATRPAGAMPRAVVARLVVNALLGIGLLAWLRAHTDWGDVAGSLLALGGILSWVAFVGKLFDDDRQKQIRRCLADWLFESPKAWRVTAVLALLALLTLGLGAVEMANVQGGDAQFRLYERNAPDPGTTTVERVAAGGRTRTPYFVSPFGTRKLTVKVNGLPAHPVDLRPWWRGCGPERVAVPGSFLYPVILVLADNVAYRELNGDAPVSYTLVIYRTPVGTDQKLVADQRPFTKEARWATVLGKPESVLAPNWVQDVPAVRALKTIPEGQFPPVARPLDLEPGDVLWAELLKADGKVAFSARSIQVQLPEDRDHLLQVLIIR